MDWSELPLVGQALILGLVQGICEFLPISSSAHLLLLPQLGGCAYLGKSFDLALHGGTLLAVFMALPRDSMDMFLGVCGRLLRGRKFVPANPVQSMGWWALGVTLVTGLIGLLVEHKVEAYCHSVELVAFCLAFFGLLLAWCDAHCKAESEPSTGRWNWRSALAIGLVQALAFIPGVSRSGIVITAGRFWHLSRQQAVRLSFLLSLPVVGAAVLFKALKGFELSSVDMLVPLGVGMGAACVSGLLCLRLFMWSAGRMSFKVFAWYRLVLAGLVLWYCR